MISSVTSEVLGSVLANQDDNMKISLPNKISTHFLPGSPADSKWMKTAIPEPFLSAALHSEEHWRTLSFLNGAMDVLEL